VEFLGTPLENSLPPAAVAGHSSKQKSQEFHLCIFRSKVSPRCVVIYQSARKVHFCTPLALSLSSDAERK
jgi:hypothetical protein